MEVSDTTMSEESTSTASSFDVNSTFDDKSVCQVCCVKAPECEKRYVHYGAICCYGCRAFFRRAHQTSSVPKFKCKNLKKGNTARIGMCSIDTKCTKQCKYCRHQKCLKAGMDPSLVLTSEQKANRFTKHNMRKEVIHQELVDPDDQNISEHKEDETSETLNVVDINPIPQYDTDNANFDLHLSTYKNRQSKNIGSDISCNTNDEGEVSVNPQYSESIGICDRRCLGTHPKGQEPNLPLTQWLPKAPKLPELENSSPLVQYQVKKYEILQRRKNTANTDMRQDLPAGIHPKRLSISSSQSLLQSDKDNSLNHRRAADELAWNTEKRISGLEGLYCNTPGSNHRAINQEDLEIESEVSQYKRTRSLDDRGKFHRRHIHPYKNTVPEMFCQKPIPQLQYHQKCENIRPLNSMELGYSKDVTAGHIENAHLPKDPLALEDFMRWCRDDRMNEMQESRLSMTRSNFADRYWSPDLNHGLGGFYSEYDDSKKYINGEISNLISDKLAERSHASTSMSSNKIRATSIARNTSFDESWSSQKLVFSNNNSPIGGKTIIKKHSSEKTSILAEIDKIFEIFIPAMRANVIQPEFVTDLINLHKNNEMNKIREIDNVDIKRNAEAQNPTLHQSKYTLHPDDLLAHFYNLGKSFKNFASMADSFKDLCDWDQMVLLEKNSTLFIMYLFARYFSSDVALEQLSWLIKGCGINMPIELVKDSDLFHLSPMTFDEFNDVCPIITVIDEPERLACRFSNCITKIKEEFQYPQYYNGLMGLLLLYSNDKSYELSDTHKIQKKYKEIQNLAITGYDHCDNFTADSLTNVIESLREMSNVFHKVHGRAPWTTANVVSKSLKKEDYFEHDQGRLIQIKPIDYSKHSNNTVLDLYHQIPRLEEMHCNERLSSLLAGFEKAFASVTSGFILRINIDIAVGNIPPEDIPPEYTAIGMQLVFERYRRALNNHKEFSRELSDYDRSALWYSNLPVASAITVCKMNSAISGEEQFMFRVGLLRPESNVLWDHEFIGYHGLKSVSDIQFVTTEDVACGRLSQYDLNCCCSLAKRVSPLMANPISFQLITMIMLLDTSHVEGAEHTRPEKQNRFDDDSLQSNSSFEECVPSLSEVYFGNDISFQPRVECYKEGLTCGKNKKRRRQDSKERFQGVKILQGHYMHLLKVHCKYIGEANGGYLGNTDERLFETMNCIRKVAKYALALTQQ